MKQKHEYMIFFPLKLFINRLQNKFTQPNTWNWHDTEIQQLWVNLTVSTQKTIHVLSLSHTHTHTFRHAVAASSHSGETWAEARPSLDQNPVGGARNHGRIPEGSFSGQGRHKDGASLGELVGSVVELLVWCNVTGKRWLTHWHISELFVCRHWVNFQRYCGIGCEIWTLSLPEFALLVLTIYFWIE